jgi:phosphonatase-like hydrolase
LSDLDLVILDLAGTTVEDRGQVPSAFTAALGEQGIVVTPEEIGLVRGASKREALRQFIPAGPKQADIAALAYTSFRAHLAQLYESEGVRAVNGAADVFRMLRERGVRVALNTGFDRDTTVLLLAPLKWLDGIVDAVICGDDVKEGRPAPYLIFRAMEATGARDVHRVANVGDTTLDLRAGYNAGVHWNIGVLSGAHSREALERAPHTHILDSVSDVAAHVLP